MERFKCQPSFLTFIFEAVLVRICDHISLPLYMHDYSFFSCTKPCLAIVQQYSMHQTSTKYQRFARKIGLSTAQEGTSASDFLEFLLGYARTQNGAPHCTLVVLNSILYAHRHYQHHQYTAICHYDQKYGISSKYHDAISADD